MNKKYLLALIMVIIVAVGIFVFTSPPFGHLPLAGEDSRTNESLPLSASLRLENGQEIKLRVADEPKERALGLSYFKSLSQDQGMLFLFDKPGVYPFWMKDMNFPLDIIWLKRGQDGGYRVVYVAHNVLPSSYPNSINPKMDADAVLEINPPAGGDSATVYNLSPEKNLWITFKK